MASSTCPWVDDRVCGDGEQLFPRASRAMASRKVLSTPPEKATRRESSAVRRSRACLFYRLPWFKHMFLRLWSNGALELELWFEPNTHLHTQPPFSMFFNFDALQSPFSVFLSGKRTNVVRW
jgi:hypothetical protein